MRLIAVIVALALVAGCKPTSTESVACDIPGLVHIDRVHRVDSIGNVSYQDLIVANRPALILTADYRVPDRLLAVGSPDGDTLTVPAPVPFAEPIRVVDQDLVVHECK